MLLSYNQIEIPHRDVTPTTIPKPYYEMLVEENAQEKPVETPTTTKKPSVYDYWESLTTRIQNRTQQQPTTNISTKWKSPYSDQKKWVSDMTAAYKRQGLSDNAIKNLLAKNSLESNWGTSTLSKYNNFGGITAGRSWKGDIIESGDKDKNGNPIKQKFRSYKSLDDYVKDEIQFLTNLYDFNQNDDINTFLSKLQGNNKGRRSYAEDPSYKNKIKQRYLNI